jgi:hypothetical protein
MHIVKGYIGFELNAIKIQGSVFTGKNMLLHWAQMPLSQRKVWYSRNYLHFNKYIVPFLLNH